jgi:hypothetical protein
MTKTRVALLATTFLFAFNFQPGWVIDNFYVKADFYRNLPFEVPFFIFQLIFAVVTTSLLESGIRFVKKFA